MSAEGSESGPVEWQASRYERLSDPQERWAAEVLDRLAPAAGERILDAGCGSGRVTRMLCERLAAQGPGWSVLAVDASQAMIDQARAGLAEFGDAVQFRCADLLALELSPEQLDETLRRPVDAVFSSAVFHWIADHEALFQRIFGWLRPGGRLVAQCGGRGNVAEWDQATQEAMKEPPFRAYFEGWNGPWNFAAPEPTLDLLERAGFKACSCWLQDKTVEVADGHAYLEVVGLVAHLVRLPQDLHGRFVDAVLRRVKDPNTLHYVRLNIEAGRPESAAGTADRLEV